MTANSFFYIIREKLEWKKIMFNEVIYFMLIIKLKILFCYKI